MRKIVMLLALLMYMGLQAINAQNTISGVVTGAADGAPVPGATVVAKGVAGVGTVTDMDGKFSLKIPANVNVITVTFVGMKPQDVDVAGKTIVNVALESGDVSLNDVVVTALGIKRQPKELGYSVTKMDNQAISQGRQVNVSSSLTGKVAGLQINTVNSGVGADNARIVIRGNRSLLGNNQALLVLDGVPSDLKYLNAMNPGDIDNITVLKGANASALYGSDAANGVILVTTKKGTDHTSVEYSNTTTFETVSFMPKFQTQFGSGSAVDKYGQPTYIPFENQNYGTPYDGSMVSIGRAFQDGTTQKIVYQDNSSQKKNFFQTGITTQNNISYSSGDDKHKIYLSLQDALINGTVPKDQARRTSFRLNGSRMNGDFTANYNVNYTHRSQDVAGKSIYQDRSVYFLVLNTPNGIPLTNYKDWRNDPYADPNGYFNDYYENPYMTIDKSRQQDQFDYLTASLDLNYKFTNWLGVQLRSSLNMDNNTTHYTKEAVHFSDYAKSIRKSIASSDLTGSVSDGSNFNQKWVNDFILSASKDFGDYSVKLIAGATTKESFQKTVDVAANALEIDNYYNIKNRVGDPSVLSSNYFRRRDVGFYGDLTLGYKQYLFLHATGRNDMTSVLAASNNSFFYPGVDVSFIFSEAVPMLKQYLSYGKLRAGIAQVGTVQVSPYSMQNVYKLSDYNSLSDNSNTTANVYNNSYNFPYGTTTGFTVSNTLNNPKLKPEMTVSKEMGIELGFLDNRITFNFTDYQVNTKDQTVPVQISSASGYSSAYVNTGETQNNGLEFETKFVPFSKPDGVTWEIGLNYTYQTSKVVSLQDSTKELFLGGYTDGTGAYAIVGQDYPSLKVIDFQRDPQGRVVVDGATGYPIKNTTAVNVGSVNPKHILGISTNVKYKNFNLGIVAEYRGGGLIWNNIANQLNFTGTGWFSATNGRQRFVFPNSVIKQGNTYVPNTNVVTSQGGVDFWTGAFNDVESPYVTSSDFWKIREISLSYSAPQKYLPKLVKRATVAFIARNVLTLLPKSNYYTDPEFNLSTGNSSGITDVNQTAPTRSYGFNIAVNF